MAGLRYGILASTALALVLAATGPAPATPATAEAIEAAIPRPDSADLPPPTLSDIDPASGESRARGQQRRTRRHHRDHCAAR